MRAIVYDRFGGPDVLTLRDLPEPQAAPGRSRIAVHAAALNPKDVMLRKGRLKWVIRDPLPRRCGFDVAGELLDPAPGLAVGTRVFGMIQKGAGGACAEMTSLRHDEFAAAPASLTMGEAAGLPLAALTALQGLRDELRVTSGQRVLLNGASGGVGVFAVQIGKALGAHVTAVCSHRNVELVASLGADDVVDYGTQDVAELRGFDAVFDIFGSVPWSKAQPMLRGRGRFCTTIPRPGAVARGLLRRVGLHRASLVVVQSKRKDLEWLARKVEAGELRSIVDSTVALQDVAEGHRRLETKRARGKVVVSVIGP